MKQLSIYVICAALSGCVSQYEGRKLSVLTINSKYRNSRIINRFPDYGDGHRDGCIVLPEIRLDLTKDKKGNVSGIVTDVTSKERLPNITVVLTGTNGKEYQKQTDSLGYFQAYLPGELHLIQLNALFYRTLRAKL